MKKTQICIGVLFMLILCGCEGFYDVIIKNGTVIDGSGSAGIQADVAIRGDKIVAIGDLSGKFANTIIDASERIVSPGFIDPHSHTDTKLLVNPRAESKIRQGVTTEIVGNCGYSPYPYLQEERSEEASANKFTDFKSYCAALEENGIAINQLALVGHGNLRWYVMGNVDAQPDAEQMQTMKNLLELQLKQGAWGMSSGLEYTPGSFATTEELIDFAKVLKKYKAIYATHMRSEDKHLIEAVDEAIRIGRESGARVQISHFKACNKPYWPLIDLAMERVREARKSGLQISADRYPYTAYATSLNVFLPPWARAGTEEDILVRLNDPKIDSDLRKYAEQKFINIGGHDKFLISDCKNPQWIGKTVEEGMQESGLAAYDFVKQVLLEDINTDMIGFAMDEANLRKVLKEEYVMICSDASAYAPYGALGKGKQHPRAYGSNVRVLGKYVREEGLLELPEAIRKMSGLCADTFQIPRRAYIRKGYFADIVVFDPEQVIDKATYTDPHLYPEGVDYVFVNGKLAVENGRHSGVLNGRMLKKR